MMNKKDIPAKMLALQLKDPNLLYNCYMPFFRTRRPVRTDR